MGATTQYDINAGFDPSALSSITAVQFLQMIQQAAPLSNIGMLVIQAGANANTTIAQGTSGSPSITDNPRFARYIWLNTFGGTIPIPYYYNAGTGDWTLVSVAAGSIVDASIAAGAAIAISKLAAGTARYLIRTNAAGTAVAEVAPASAFNTGELPEGKITPGGGNGYLKTQAGATVWVADATERAAILSALSNIPPSALHVGANNTVLGTNGAGVVDFDDINNIIGNNGITLQLLHGGGATTGDILRWNGSSWVKFTPDVNFFSGSGISNAGLIAPNAGAGTGFLDDANVQQYNHGFTTVPKIVRVCVYNTGAAEAGYDGTEDVTVESVAAAGTNKFNTIYADTTAVYIRPRLVAGLELPHKTTGVSTAITESQWKYKVRAWK